MRKVYAGVAEPDSGVRRRQNHVGAGLIVGRVLDGSHQVLGNHAQGLESPDVADRIGALIRRPHRRPLRAQAFREGQGGERFQGVAEDVEPGRGGH